MNIIPVLMAFVFVVLWRLLDIIDNNTMAICYMIMASTICITTEIKQNKNND